MFVKDSVQMSKRTLEELELYYDGQYHKRDFGDAEAVAKVFLPHFPALGANSTFRTRMLLSHRSRTEESHRYLELATLTPRFASF